MKLVDQNEESALMQRINKRLAEVAALSGDDITIHIGIGAREGTSKGMVSVECKVLGINPRAAHVGAKLVSLIAPIINDFLKNDFSAWAKKQKGDDWMTTQKGKAVLIRLDGKEASEKKETSQMPYIPPDKARA